MGGMGGSQNQVRLLESTHRMKHNNSGHGKPGSRAESKNGAAFFFYEEAGLQEVKGHGPEGLRPGVVGQVY